MGTRSTSISDGEIVWQWFLATWLLLLLRGFLRRRAWLRQRLSPPWLAAKADDSSREEDRRCRSRCVPVLRLLARRRRRAWFRQRLQPSLPLLAAKSIRQVFWAEVLAHRQEAKGHRGGRVIVGEQSERFWVLSTGLSASVVVFCSVAACET